jgi:hypothetical protein
VDFQLQWPAYLLILAALAAHYPFGRRLGVPGLLARVLVGVALSALIAGTLANFAAGLIRPYIVASIALGYGLWAYDLWRARGRPTKICWRTALTCLIAGAALFAANEPGRTFLEREGGRTTLLFNPHYPAYAGLSYEMLNARYVSRLKVPTAHPYEIAKNHFFPAATQAIGQVFIAAPGLLSYFATHTVLVILILLSLVEVTALSWRWHGSSSG